MSDRVTDRAALDALYAKLAGMTRRDVDGDEFPLSMIGNHVLYASEITDVLDSLLARPAGGIDEWRKDAGPLGAAACLLTNAAEEAVGGRDVTLLGPEVVALVNAIRSLLARPAEPAEGAIIEARAQLLRDLKAADAHLAGPWHPRIKDEAEGMRRAALYEFGCAVHNTMPLPEPHDERAHG